MNNQDQTNPTPLPSNPAAPATPPTPNPTEPSAPLLPVEQSTSLDPAETSKSSTPLNPISPTEPLETIAAQPSPTPQPDTISLLSTPLTPENPSVTSISTPTTNPKKPNNSQKIGLIAACAILLAGGIFATTKILTQDKEPECTDCNTPTTSPTNKPTSAPIAVSADNLDYAFLKLENKSENLIYSPLSIRNGLALLDRGAAGETKTEIDTVLGETAPTRYDDIENTLSVANAVFIRDNFSDKVSPDYISTTKSELNAEIIYDDFSSSTNMDNWVDKKTFSLIPQIGFQPTPDTKMVLANALAIQMDWLHQFSDDDTYGRPFYAENDKEISATVMRKETHLKDISYYTNDDVTAVALPLDSTSSTKLEFVAIMPNNTNLNEYIQSFSTTTFDSLRKQFTAASEPKDGIILLIPKFKFDYTLDFMNDLNALGISKAFSRDDANFSAMASDPLYVSAAIHKANIDFSEDGIKAAAITVFSMDIASALEEDEPQPIIINIDHPFLFLIRDQETGTVWFAGTVYRPNLWEDDQSEYEESY